MNDLKELKADIQSTLRAIACQKGGEYLYQSRIEWKAADEIQRLETDISTARQSLYEVCGQREALFKRVAELEAALRWEAAVAGDECAYPTSVFCFDGEPESPDLWCTYCRITYALKGDNDGK